MAVKRGRSQARRSGGGNGGLPGWAWMVLGIVLTIVVVLAAPKLLRSGAGDGFFRPSPNPDAEPAVATSDGDDAVAPDADPRPPAATGRGPDDADDAAEQTQYDFYTLLPGQEVAMTDAELAASARAEEARKPAALPEPANPDAADPARPDAVAASPSTATAPAVPATPAGPATQADGARYILQAGSFGESGDAEALKARIALLGLSARVEAAQIDGRAMYRVRMGPYGTATDLAEAKQKLGNGGLPALAIKAK
ncbi:MAG TPA: SPOR domain-containing protein [Luteimonas sp.]|nr:SPOR domain-containing protein [Luteimonas sp.]